MDGRGDFRLRRARALGGRVSRPQPRVGLHAAALQRAAGRLRAPVRSRRDSPQALCAGRGVSCRGRRDGARLGARGTPCGGPGGGVPRQQPDPDRNVGGASRLLAVRVSRRDVSARRVPFATTDSAARTRGVCAPDGASRPPGLFAHCRRNGGRRPLRLGSPGMAPVAGQPVRQEPHAQRLHGRRDVPSLDSDDVAAGARRRSVGEGAHALGEPSRIRIPHARHAPDSAGLRTARLRRGDGRRPGRLCPAGPESSRHLAAPMGAARRLHDLGRRDLADPGALHPAVFPLPDHSGDPRCRRLRVGVEPRARGRPRRPRRIAGRRLRGTGGPGRRRVHCPGGGLRRSLLGGRAAEVWDSRGLPRSSLRAGRAGSRRAGLSRPDRLVLLRSRGEHARFRELGPALSLRPRPVPGALGQPGGAGADPHENPGGPRAARPVPLPAHRRGNPNAAAPALPGAGGGPQGRSSLGATRKNPSAGSPGAGSRSGPSCCADGRGPRRLCVHRYNRRP